MTTSRNVSLFDVDDVTSFSKVRDLTVSKVAQSDVHEFCRRWHYSRTGGNMSWNYGLWDGFTLVGVVSYNLPTMEACAALFGAERWEWVVHMGRLVCADDAPRNSESRLIAQSLRALKCDKPSTRAVLTYAASSEGHLGYVYQATNAIYTGAVKSGHHYTDERGQMRGSKQGVRVSIADAKNRGWQVVPGLPKHRYVYLIGNKTERKEARRLLKLPVLPYPKEVTP
jgi:hypothetical protein